MSVLTFIGHSSFELQFGGTTLLFDPFFGEMVSGYARKIPPAKREGDFRDCDLILVSHEHADHCDSAAIESIAQRTGCTLVAPKPALLKVNMPERFKVDVRIGDRFELKGVEIEVVQALHPQSEYPVGFIVRKEGKSVYFAGDTYEYMGMRDISCDIAILPVGGSYTMDTLGASKAVWEMKAKTVVPMHYDTYDRIVQRDVREWAKRQTKAKVAVLLPGQSISF